MTLDSGRIPLWLKVIYTLFVACAVRVNAVEYGLENFIWFSDIALILIVPALWLESGLLASMMAVGVVLPEIGWSVVFLIRLISGARMGGILGYLFDPAIPIGVRGVSLFHLLLPPLLVWMTYRLGYDRGALLAQTILCWITLAATFFLTEPAKNINWAFGPGFPQHRLPPALYLTIEMCLFPLVVFFPTHIALSKMFGRQPKKSLVESATD